MPFEDCSCHAWAIDGYTEDHRAHVVSEEYNRLANDVMKLQSRDVNGKVDGLVSAVRSLCQTSLSAFDCTVYGGFTHETDGAPEHMWIESNNYIYDTMPGAPLRRAAANPHTRLQPPSEVRAFAPQRVGKCKAKLTRSQLSILNAAEGHWQNNTYNP